MIITEIWFCCQNCQHAPSLVVLPNVANYMLCDAETSVKAVKTCKLIGLFAYSGEKSMGLSLKRKKLQGETKSRPTFLKDLADFC